MNDAREATATLLAEKPRFESALRDVLAVDERETEWTFDDVPLDSGAFGELVSRNIVESEGDGYRLADPDGVRAALEGEQTTDDTTFERPSPSLPDVDGRVAAALTGALALLVAFRTFHFPWVFRDGNVVSIGNDPYFYRYHVERLVAASSGPFDASIPANVADLASTGEPLTVTTLWWAAELLGGDAGAADAVAAWAPIAAAVVTGLFVYLLAVRVTDDRRVGIAAVAMLAITPVHAYRTALGYVDHHAFDYAWLTLTALALVALAQSDRETRTTWAWTVALGVAIAAQVTSWDNAPLLVLPVGVYVALAVASDVRASHSPARANWPVVAGVGVAALLVHAAHVGLGWLDAFAAYAPTMLFAGCLGVGLFAELVHRSEYGTNAVVGGEIGVAALGGVVLWTQWPAFANYLVDRLDFLFSTRGIAETGSLVGGQVGTVIGPIFLFGFVLFLALPYLGWASWRVSRERDPGWLVVVVYGWFFLALAVVQMRFAGELSPFVAVFGGLGFVHLAAAVDLARPPAVFESDDSGRDRDPAAETLELPERREVASLAALSLGVASFNLLQTPVKMSQLAIGDAEYRAATWMREYADERGWEYPENYVFSHWDRNRLYNYVVSGQSGSYGYAQSNYGSFLQSTDEREWYETLADRTGFVVVRDGDGGGGGGGGGRGGSGDGGGGDGDGGGEDGRSDGSNDGNGGGGTVAEPLRTRLAEQVRGDGELEHHRLLYVSDGGTLSVFSPVAGARITGPAEPGETKRVATDVTVPGASFTDAREVSTGEFGVYDARVPYPGQYAVGDETVRVSEADVAEGRVLSRFEGDATAHWTFDEGSGGTAYDRAGGHHGTIRGASWTQEGGAALAFDGEGARVTVRGVESPQTFTASLWVNPDELDVSDENDYRDLLGGSGGSLLVLEQSGRVSFRVPGVATDRLVGGRVPLDEWTHVAASYDGETQRLYVNGERVGRKSAGDGTVEFGDATWIGSRPNGGHAFSGTLDDVRIEPRALSGSEVEARYEDGR